MTLRQVELTRRQVEMTKSRIDDQVQNIVEFTVFLIIIKEAVIDVIFEASKIQWGLTKQFNYINESDVLFVVWLIESVKRRRERSFHSLYSYDLLFVTLDSSKMNEYILDALKVNEVIFDESNLLLKRR